MKKRAGPPPKPVRVSHVPPLRIFVLGAASVAACIYAIVHYYELVHRPIPTPAPAPPATEIPAPSVIPVP